MAEFQIVDSQRLLSSFVFNVDRVTVVGDETFYRDVVRHPGAVAIVAVNKDDEVALLRQWRVTLGHQHLEIPAGTCDVAAEDPLATAKRELLEEIGATSEEWTELCSFYNSPGWTDQTTVVFLAHNIELTESRPSGPEETAMEVEWWSRAQVQQLLQPGCFLDGTATIGLRTWLSLP
ncbi:MAG: NUDIX hydrolase [Acidobacteria bacterium]|nr:NUDIX hydrolase [Acidobacteriota bacterium]